MKINFAEPALPKTGAIVVCIGKDNKLGAAAEGIDKATDGAIQRALKNSKFTGKAEQILEIVAPAGVSLSRVILAGVGDGLDERAQANLGGRVLARLTGAGERSATIAVDIGVEDAPRACAQVAYGALLRSYRFTKYKKKKKKKNDEAELSTLRFTVKGAAAARRAFTPLAKIADGVFFTRDLVSEPPNILFPASFAREARKLDKLGVKVQVIGEKQMAKLGMGALLGVGQGSRRESQLVVMQWKGGAQNSKPIAFIGKGVTFRHRRHIAQALTGHGRHEMGHGRRRRGVRIDEGRGRP